MGFECVYMCLYAIYYMKNPCENTIDTILFIGEIQLGFGKQSPQEKEEHALNARLHAPPLHLVQVPNA